MKQIHNSSQVEIAVIDDENYVIIELETNNIAKLSLQIIYLKEYGYKNFLIKYKFQNIDISITKVLAKLKIDYLLGLAKEYGFKFRFEGFSRCIYEKYILKPELRKVYEKLVGFVPVADCDSDRIKRDECELCLFNDKCKGICEGYINKFGEKEFSPLISNEDLYDLNKTELETFTNKELIRIGNIILDDYRKESLYLRKKFSFSASYPKENINELQENFTYTIYNREDDFDKTYDLISDFFDKSLLEMLKKYISVSNQLGLYFNLNKEQEIERTFTFTIHNFNLSLITSLSKILNIEIKPEKSPHSIIIQIRGEKIQITVSYASIKSTIIELKSFVKDITLENKRLFLKYSNSLIKPVNNAFFNYTYKNNEMFSKMVTISLKHNSYRFTQFYTLFKIPLKFFEDKEFDTISFRIKNGGEERIFFDYTLTLPEEEIVEEDEGE